MWPNKKALKLRSWTAFIVSSCTNWEKFLRLLDCLPVQLWHVNKINIFQDIRARLSSLVEMRCWVLALTQGGLVDCFLCATVIIILDISLAPVHTERGWLWPWAN